MNVSAAHPGCATDTLQRTDCKRAAENPWREAPCSHGPHVVKMVESPEKRPMLGSQEFLVVAALVAGAIFIPRMMVKKEPQRPAGPKVQLSGKIRIAIAASCLYPAIAAAYFQPWRKDPFIFLYAGIGPVATAWMIWWIFQGFRKK